MHCRPGFGVTQLLDFFESAPLLRAGKLRGLSPGLSGAPLKFVTFDNYLLVSPSPNDRLTSFATNSFLL